MISLWIGIVVGLLIASAVLVKILARASGATSADVKEKIRQGAVTIDVRTPSEYQSGHYTGAKNIPLQELQGRLTEIGGKNKAIVIYCASGMRSAEAVKILTAAGFTDVTNAGGLSNLKQ